MQGFSTKKMPLSLLTGISKAQIRNLEKIGLYTIEDLLFHFPIRYEDRTRICQIRNLFPGIHVTLLGRVLSCTITLRNRKVMNCRISDGSGTIIIKFFNFKVKMKHYFFSGRYILAYGEIKLGKCGLEMIHPEFRTSNDIYNLKLPSTLTPIYPITKGVNQTTIRSLINQSLNLLNHFDIDELIPSEISKHPMSLSEALYIVHRPSNSIRISELNAKQHPAQQRLIFEELLAYNLCITVRLNMKRFHTQPLVAHNDLKNKLLNSLPFKLTNAQNRAVMEIESDMSLNTPMLRLLQGDVGSGKTLVAALAALHVISHNKQVALMAPTEILSEQHVNNFRRWFLPLGVEVSRLTRTQKYKSRFEQDDSISSGKVKMVIGTHAIFQKQVRFHNLSLIIIDEQHRFGVEQQIALLEKGFLKGNYPHQLIMTATPIPRTLAMSSYDYLNTSIIDELPSGRKPITTVIIPDTRRKDIIDRVRYACSKEGRQTYWVCTLIEQSEHLEVQSAIIIWNCLRIELSELNIGLVHGRMKFKEKQEIMNQFKQGNLHVLVTTTIIEVGIDVPNASLMIIENSDRLGLAQLHQLRGRVGRNTVESYCILLYKSPLSEVAHKRLQALRNSSSGFFIARKDLEIRGPGDLIGTHQTGNIAFKIADFIRDQKSFIKAHRIAYRFHERFPENSTELIHRWISTNQILNRNSTKLMKN